MLLHVDVNPIGGLSPSVVRTSNCRELARTADGPQQIKNFSGEILVFFEDLCSSSVLACTREEAFAGQAG